MVNLIKIYDIKDLLNALQEFKLIPSEKICPNCQNPMEIRPNQSKVDGFEWHCRAKYQPRPKASYQQCDIRRRIRDGTLGKAKDFREVQPAPIWPLVPPEGEVPLKEYFARRNFWAELPNLRGIREDMIGGDRRQQVTIHGPNADQGYFLWARGQVRRLTFASLMRLRDGTPVDGDMLDYFTRKICSENQGVQTIKFMQVKSYPIALRAPDVNWRIEDTRIIMIRLHVNMSHWVMAILNPKEHSATVFDSANSLLTHADVFLALNNSISTKNAGKIKELLPKVRRLH